MTGADPSVCARLLTCKNWDIVLVPGWDIYNPGEWMKLTSRRELCTGQASPRHLGARAHLVNFDQSASPVSLNTEKTDLYRPPFWAQLRINVATKHSASQWNIGSGRPASVLARGCFRVPTAIALETISAQSDRGDRELSAPTVWNCYVYHRPVHGHIRRVRNRSLVGAARKRHGTRI